MRARLAHAPTCCVRARARACVCDWAPTNPRRNVPALSVGVDCVRLGSQAFQSASAFNANIGAWNTASVTSLSGVWAAFFGPGGAPPRWDALGGSSKRHGPLMRKTGCMDVCL